jgi:hypothetical protein
MSWGGLLWYSETLLVSVAFVATVVAFVADVFEAKGVRVWAEAIALLGWAAAIIELLGVVIGWMWFNPQLG